MVKNGTHTTPQNKTDKLTGEIMGLTQNKTALVTGGASGIRRTSVVAFAKSSVNFFIIDIDVAGMNAVTGHSMVIDGGRIAGEW